MADLEYWKTFYKEEQRMPPSNFARYCTGWFRNSSSVLDAGCGDGRDAVLFAQEGYKVIAADIVDTVRGCGITFRQVDISKLNDFHVGNVYCRFTLHSLTIQQESDFLDWCSRNIERRGLLAIEGRSIGCGLFQVGTPGPDKNSKITDHYRRFLDIDELSEKIEGRGFEVLRAFQDTGLAPMNGEDPLIVRIIARKK